MTWGLWCVLIAGLLPYIATGAAKWGAKNYDNRNPRVWLANQTGFRARGNSAQANAFETFPLFAAAVLIASFVHAPQSSIDLWATIFVIARFLYIIFYLIDRDRLRSLSWLVGVISVVSLFVISNI